MSLNLFATLINKAKKLFLNEYSKKEKIKMIGRDTYLVQGDLELLFLEKLITVDFSENRNTTLKEFLEERINKNGIFYDSFEYKNYVFIPQDVDFQNVMIKKQCLNGKPLFYV